MLPELIGLDEWGYPILDTRAVPDDLIVLAKRAVSACPVLALTGRFYLTGGAEAAADVWRRTFAPKAQGAEIACGHFLAEEAPEETAAALERFLAGGG